MNGRILAWKNLWFRPMPTLLSILLFALGTGLAAFLLLFNKQVQEKFDANLAGVDLVIGAKGSPLQLILCNMYHIDVPTGNIPVREARPFLNPAHPLISEAVPLSLGDSYKGFRIVGTTDGFLGFYGLALQEGGSWEKDFEVLAGHEAAVRLGLKVGDHFHSAHGLSDDDMNAHDDVPPFVVKGILAPSGTVADQLLLCPAPTVWAVHGSHDGSEEHDDHEHDHVHDHEDEVHNDHSGRGDTIEMPVFHTGSVERILAAEDEAITSILVRFKGRNFQALNMQRNINENTDLQAATPAIEINRLYSLMGIGAAMLRNIAMAIIIVSALSVFLLLFHSLRSRKYELALMRVMGGRPASLFSLIIWEGLFISLLGCILGILMAHGAMALLSDVLESQYRYPFTGWMWMKEEYWLIGGAAVIGIVAAVIPGWRAQRTDISRTLAA